MTAVPATGPSAGPSFGPGAEVGAAAEPASPRVAPVAAVWFAVGVFSTGPVAVASSSVSSPVFSFWRLWAGVPILAALTLWHLRRQGSRPTARGWGLAAAAGVAFGVHQVAFMSALKATSVVDVTLMNTLAPIVVGILAVPLFGERPGVAFRLWSFVAIAGAAAVALIGSTGVGGDPVGMALAAFNVVAFSVYFVWSKRARRDIDTWPLLFGALGTAALVVTAYVLATDAPLGSVEGRDLLLALFVAVVPGTIGHGSLTWSLRFVPANLPPVLMLLIPIFSGLLAWLILGQSVTGATVVAGLVTLAGVLGAISAPDATPAAVEALDLAEEC